MPVVTEVVTRGRSRLADLWLDDGSVVTLSRDTVGSLSIKAGTAFSATELASVRAEDERARAVAAAVRLLSLRARSRKDLGERLRRRGFRAAAVEAALTRMAALGYLDDAAFARS